MKKGAVESSNTIIPTAINWRRQVSAWKGIRWRKQRYIVAAVRLVACRKFKRQSDVFGLRSTYTRVIFNEKTACSVSVNFTSFFIFTTRPHSVIWLGHLVRLSVGLSITLQYCVEMDKIISSTFSLARRDILDFSEWNGVASLPCTLEMAQKSNYQPITRWTVETMKRMVIVIMGMGCYVNRNSWTWHIKPRDLR